MKAECVINDAVTSWNCITPVADYRNTCMENVGSDRRKQKTSQKLLQQQNHQGQLGLKPYLKSEEPATTRLKHYDLSD